MSDFVRIFQIGYKPEHEKKIEPGWTYLDNSESCTIYFENSIISALIDTGQHLGCKYFGAVSHKLQHNINTSRRGPRVDMDRWDKPTFEARLDKSGADIFGFLQYMPHDPVRYFLAVHPQLPFYFREVTDRLGAIYNGHINMRHVFYSNAFVARPHIYERYVKEFLNPAIKIMDEMPELMQDSGYPIELPDALKKKWGIGWFPLHTFICERLFSYWVHLQGDKLTVKYY